MTKPRLNDTEKQLIRDMHANGDGVRVIARHLQRSPSTIHQFCKREELFYDTTRTEHATAQRLAFSRKRRLAAAEELLDDIMSMRARIWDEYKVVVNTPEGTDTIVLDEPPLKEQADGYKAIEAMVRTYNTLMDGIDTDAGNQGKSVLADMMRGLSEMIKNDPTAGMDDTDQDHEYDVKDHLND